jgi:hypothetical protein
MQQAAPAAPAAPPAAPSAAGGGGNPYGVAANLWGRMSGSDRMMFNQRMGGGAGGGGMGGGGMGGGMPPQGTPNPAPSASGPAIAGSYPVPDALKNYPQYWDASRGMLYAR